jgi:large repetitive protein
MTYGVPKKTIFVCKPTISKLLQNFFLSMTFSLPLKKDTLFKIITLFIVCIAMHFHGYSQMTQMSRSTTGNDISKISFYSNTQGYVAFKYNLGYTADSGRTFTLKYITNRVDFNGYPANLTFGFNINGVKAFSHDTLLAYGDYGWVPAILYSVDGGNNFKLIYHSQFSFYPNSEIYDMVFPTNGNTGYAVDKDRVLKTIDRGQSWYVVRTQAAGDYNAIDAVDDNNIFISNNDNSDPSLVRSNDGGATWSNVPIPPGNTFLLSVDFLTPQKGWLNMRTNTEFKLYYTPNSGNSWQQINDNEAAPFIATKMRFINDSTGYAFNSGLFNTYRTTDSGKAWQPLVRVNNSGPLNGAGYHNDIQIYNGTRIWAGGTDGLLELGTNGGGKEVPKAYYKIDRTGADTSGIIHLVNYSKAGYQYRWYKNDTLISTSYHANYVHQLWSLRDSIALVVTDGTWKDSVIKYINFPRPISIHSFNPATGMKQTLVTIRGDNLRDVTAVSFGGTPANSISLLSDTLITVRVGDGGSGSVTISNEVRRDSLAGFRFTGLIIRSFAPDTGRLGGAMTISGENFRGVTNVAIGTTPVSSFTIIDSTKINVVIGPGTSGAVSVYHTNGIATAPGFRYTGPPVITSFTPSTSGPIAEIAITGINLIGTYQINFGGSPPLSFAVNSASSVKATINAGSSGNVTIYTPAGTTTLGGFVYVPPPVITSFQPLSGQAGATVTIRGKNFNTVPDSNSVYFGPARAIVTTATDSLLTVIVPTGATASPISVTCHRLTDVSLRSFLPGFPGATNPVEPTAFSGKTIFKTTRQTGAFFHDFDGDGKNDMVVTDRHTFKFTVYKNTSTHNITSFGSPQDFFSDYGNPPNMNVQAADMNGDGKPDLVLQILGAVQDQIFIYIYKNISANGVIAFASRVKYITYQPTHGVPLYPSTYYTLRDFDKDGRTDILCLYGDLQTPELHFYKNTTSGDSIAFAAKTTIAHESATSVDIIDMDNDGKEDLVLTHDNYSVHVLLNQSVPGTIKFALFNNFPVNETFLSPPAVKDLDGDNKPDLFFYKNDSTWFTILKNTSIPGTVSFAPKVNRRIPNRITGFMVSDVDGDSNPDVLVTHPNSIPASFGIFRNNSTGGNILFADPANFSVADTLSAPYCIDVSGDGRPELIFTANTPYGVTIVGNRTTGSSIPLCLNSTTSIVSENSGSSYQWQVNTGNGFTNVSNNANITGATTNTLHFSNIPLSWNGYQYRCITDGNAGYFYTFQFINSWKGTVNNEWENPANWSCGTVPESTTDVLINSGTVILNSNTTVKSLSADPAATIIVNPGFTLTVIQ